MRHFIFLTLFLVAAYTSTSLGELTAATPVKKRILVIFDYSGSAKVTSQLYTTGAEIAFSRYPNLKRDYEFVRVDMGSDVKSVAEVVGKAMDEFKPVAIFGPINSNHAFVISGLAEEKSIPYVAPVATHVKLTEGKKFTFRACYDDSFQAAKLADFIFKSRKRRKGVVIYNETQSYAQGVKEIFEKRFKELGGKEIVTFAISSEKDLTDEMLGKIEDLKPEFVLVPSYQIEAAAVLSKLSRHLEPNVEYFGPDSWGGGRMFEKIFESTQGDFKGFYAQHWAQESKSPENKEFLRLLKSYPLPKDMVFDGTAMNSPIALGYDGMTIILEAIKHSQKRPLVEILRKTVIKGASGKIDLRSGPTPKKGLFIFEINKNGERYSTHYE